MVYRLTFYIGRSDYIFNLLKDIFFVCNILYHISWSHETFCIRIWYFETWKTFFCKLKSYTFLHSIIKVNKFTKKEILIPVWPPEGFLMPPQYEASPFCSTQFILHMAKKIRLGFWSNYSNTCRFR